MLRIRIATRKSPLALWQANEVAKQLRELHEGLQVELVKMSTQGDKVLDSPLSKIGGKGLFVKELEQGLLQNEADIAVHSMKDVPMAFPDGLQLTVIMQREDPRDAFVANNYANLAELPANAVIGTSSLRRQAQIAARYPNFSIKPLRGNVGSRLRKLDEGKFDAIILATAGLLRLELAERITEPLDSTVLLPAVGQGAIGIECRSDDEATQQLIQPLHDLATAQCVLAERAMNQRLNGGCQVPIAGYAVHEANSQLWMRGLVADPDGSQVLFSEQRGEANNGESLGQQLAEDLLQQGAATILSAAGL